MLYIIYSQFLMSLLLQPRKFKRKSLQKNRNFKLWSSHTLSYGTSGVRIQQALHLSAKMIYRMKLFLKRAVRKSDRTQRYMWFSAFPHLPLTRKGKGSRMGKGNGKLSTWWVRLKPGIILVEFKHLRYGRIVYFFKQISYKSPINVQLIVCNMGSVTMRHTSRANATLLPFN